MCLVSGSLKNAIEWFVYATLFSEKPRGLITASASGEKGHLELQLVMRTEEAKFTNETMLLISGIKGKFDSEGNLFDTVTLERLQNFVISFEHLLKD